MSKYGVDVLRHRLYRAKKKVNEEVEGSHDDSYSKLSKYADLIRETNPGSFVKMKLDRPSLNIQPKFMRYFVCFKALSKGFVE